MQDDFFLQAFVYLGAAVVAVPLARLVGLGSVLGYLLAGAAIGPFALGLVGGEGTDVLHFAEFGVVMMLFLIGLELEPAKLWALRGTLLGLGGLQVVVTSAALAAGAFALGAEWRVALACGLVLSLSSTAIVLQSLRERGLSRTDAGERAFAVLLFQDVAVIPMLVLLPLLAAHAAAPGAGHADALGAALPAWGRALATLAAVALIALAGRFAVPPLFRVIARSRAREAFTAAALLLVVGIVLLMQLVGVSPALGTFLGGVALAGGEYRHQLEGEIEPFKGLLLGLFFLSVGASIDFGVIAASAAPVAGIVLGLIAVKLGVLLAIGRVARMSGEQTLLFAAALAQGGEFAFVLFSLAAQSGVLERAMVDLLVASVALSMAATPLLLLGWGRGLQPRLGASASPEREPDAIDREGRVILAGFGAFGSIVGRFLIASGVETVVLDTDSDHVALMRGLGIQAFYGDASREDLLRAAGAERARILIAATDTLESTQAVIRTAKRCFPGLRVLARAKTRMDAYELLDSHADRVYRASLDTSLRAGVDVLRELGFPAHQALRSAQRFRRYDEAAWQELAAVRKDESLFQGRARDSIRMLERLLQAEFHGHGTLDESAWDSASLRDEFGPGTRATEDD